MKKICLAAVSFVVAFALMGLLRIESVNARPTYYKAFKKKYVGDEKTDAQKSIAKSIKRVKGCNICHDPHKGPDGKVSKKNRNPYGVGLSKLLTEKDQKNVDKALEALTKTEKVKLKDSKQTVGECLKAGKLPFEYKETKEVTSN